MIALLLILAGILQLLPLRGVLGRERLNALYGLTLDEPNMLLMLRHRALLFGLLGALLLAAAFIAPLQPFALAAGLLSTLSFILLAKLTPGYNEALRKMVIADWLSLASLLVALTLYLLERHAANAF